MLGYEKDLLSCADINECSNATSNICNQTCINTPGSYYCACYSGYRLNGLSDCKS